MSLSTLQLVFANRSILSAEVPITQMVLVYHATPAILSPMGLASSLTSSTSKLKIPTVFHLIRIVDAPDADRDTMPPMEYVEWWIHSVKCSIMLKGNALTAIKDIYYLPMAVDCRLRLSYRSAKDWTQVAIVRNVCSGTIARVLRLARQYRHCAILTTRTQERVRVAVQAISCKMVVASTPQWVSISTASAMTPQLSAIPANQAMLWSIIYAPWWIPIASSSMLLRMFVRNVKMA